MAINIIISFNNRTTNENNRKDNFSSALIFNFFCLLFAQFKRANRLRVLILNLLLYPRYLSLKSDNYYSVAQSCDRHNLSTPKILKNIHRCY